jgi:hypothetical protein
MRFDLPWVQVWAMDRGAVVRHDVSIAVRAAPPAPSPRTVASERIGASGKQAQPLPAVHVPASCLACAHGCADGRLGMRGSAFVPPSQQPTCLDKVRPWANHGVLQPGVDASCAITRRTKGECRADAGACEMARAGTGRGQRQSGVMLG